MGKAMLHSCCLFLAIPRPTPPGTTHLTEFDKLTTAKKGRTITGQRRTGRSHAGSPTEDGIDYWIELFSRCTAGLSTCIFATPGGM